MPDVLLFVVAFFGTALLSFAVTPLAAKVAGRLGVVDRPGQRKIHPRPVPLVGGIAVSLGLLTGALACGVAIGWDSLLSHLGGENEGPLLWGCAMVLVVGVIDDVGGLTAIIRVAIEVAAAVVVMQAGYVIDSVWTPWGDIPLGCHRTRRSSSDDMSTTRQDSSIRVSASRRTTNSCAVSLSASVSRPAMCGEYS